MQTGRRLGTRRRESMERTGTAGEEDGSVDRSTGAGSITVTGGQSRVNQNELHMQ